ncbi:MAG: hypothetical protein Tsb009_16460 [Planctomycetaceae bacterium]
MVRFFSQTSPELLAGLFFLIGLVIGHQLIRWVIRLTPRTERSPNPLPFKPSPLMHVPLLGSILSPKRCIYRGENIARKSLLTELGTGILFAGFTWMMMVHRCQFITEVRPDEISQYIRILYHLILFTFLIAATGTDFRDYVIPDRVIVPGILVAIIGATWSGDLQIVHLWVDANQEIPGLQAAYIPGWIAENRHWHGLLVSLTGMMTGAGLTWLVRLVSSFFLGEETMGFGDVTLMAMIGAYLGWQPVLVVFLLAPFCGLFVAVLSRMIAGTAFIPYGPYLSAATVVVLFSWKWIWPFEVQIGTDEIISVRKIFGDLVGLGILIGIALTALAVLLGLLRMYRTIPVSRPQREVSENSTTKESL